MYILQGVIVPVADGAGPPFPGEGPGLKLFLIATGSGELCGSGGRPGPLGFFGHGVEVVSPAVRGLGLVPPCGQRRPAKAAPRLSLSWACCALCAPFYRSPSVSVRGGARHGSAGRGRWGNRAVARGAACSTERGHLGHLPRSNPGRRGGSVGLAGSCLQAAADAACLERHLSITASSEARWSPSNQQATMSEDVRARRSRMRTSAGGERAW